MKRWDMLAAAGLGLVMAWPGAAADFSDPTWPCVQRKVERLSPGLMWPNPIPDTLPDDADLRRAIGLLADTLSVRSIELEALDAEVSAFVQAYGGDADLLGLVFSEVFDSLSRRRTRIIGGIEDFSLSQIALSEQIDQSRQDMTAEMDKADPNFDKVDKLEEQIDWEQTIYTDRQQSITYLCETPTLLERRLYGIAQMLQAKIDEG